MPGWELIGAEERAALNEIFDNQNGVMFAHGFDSMRNGNYKVREYERAFASRMGVRQAQAVSSGTAALTVALKALNIGPGDEVITQAFTFVATVEAILACGAIPVVCDVDHTFTLDGGRASAAVTSRTKAVIPVHMMGECADMGVLRFSARHIPIIEDAAQALGASYRGIPAGAYGLAGCYSTDAGKTLCTGEGGMVVTNDQLLYEGIRAQHDHGHAYGLGPRGEDRGVAIGFNYRLTELQAAVGLAQLQKLDVIVARQRENKALLMARIGHLPLQFRRCADPHGDLADTLVFSLHNRRQATQFADALIRKGVGTKNLPDALNWHSAGHWPLYLRNECRHDGTAWQATTALLERSIALPIMVNMAEEQIVEMAAIIYAVHTDMFGDVRRKPSDTIGHVVIDDALLRAVR